jgi:hypothetical protein
VASSLHLTGAAAAAAAVGFLPVSSQRPTDIHMPVTQTLSPS